MKTPLKIMLIKEGITKIELIRTSSRASYQQLYTTEYTAAKLLELQAKQEIEISRKDKAAYFDITIRSLNRALKSLE